MKITVTEEDIKLGKRSSMAACPVALAIKRITKNTSVLIDERYVSWLQRDSIKLPSMVYKDTPADVQWFIKNFDDGVVVEPFEFELNDSTI